VSERSAALREAAARAGVRDRRVLAAVAAVPRAVFLPGDQVRDADLDIALPLPCAQTTSQPSLVAQMVEALELTPASRVLEIGTGHGYEAAILSRLAAEVWTVEYVAELADTAREILRGLGIANVHVVCGDGRLGLPEHAPYDAIVVAAQCVRVPAALLDQLAVGGHLVAPVGGTGAQRCVVLRRHDEDRVDEVGDLGGVRFVPLVGTAG
jgi:protein-L-isoaspartate(D-aspartate) O-methyltransferase